MKNDLDYYLNLPYKLSITPDLEEGGYVAEYPELPGCITCGESISEVISLAEDAKKCWLTVSYENHDDIPIPDSLNKYSGQFKLRVPKFLHRILALRAKEEGISMNQYCVAVLARHA
ncbi:MAG: type II toxin-antitoxin system HicB family antitoxin [Lachnospiraceae bacterium]|nr:type II toxin-antitoxin system HicB family antitoxin [Lachnospiraceae bacterium]